VHVLCGDTQVPGAGSPSRPDHELRVDRSLRLHSDGTDLLRPPWRERLSIERHNQATLERTLSDVQPDVISIWHLAAVSQGLLRTIVDSGIPVVLAVCDDWLIYSVGIDPWASAFNGSGPKRALGRLVERATGVPCVVPDIGDLGPFLFVTAAIEGNAVRKGFWHPERRAVVWSGIDRTAFPPADRVPRPFRHRLITTGRFDPRKGFETAVRALVHLPAHASLECWGRGGDEERARLQAIAEELGVADRVRLGSLTREELVDRYRAADVMLFPSTWAEPFGLVPIEAMACGTPVLATGVGGSAEFLVDGGNCLYFTPGDPHALAERVEQLAGDEGLRDRLVQAGHRTAEEMDVERLADVMEAWHVYEAGGRQGPEPAPRTITGVAPGP
jgi:glycosyltransferase involved in cell wall biosynthesis